MIALQDVVRRAEIPPEPFRKLIQANRIDQGTGRFATYAGLLRYCDHSANPVGRMVLHVLGAASEENGRLSDATCTALQLANFWQDVARDYRIGRVYLPQEDLRAFGCVEERIAEGAADEAFRALMRVSRSTGRRRCSRRARLWRTGCGGGRNWRSRCSARAECACWTRSASRTTTR